MDNYYDTNKDVPENEFPEEINIEENPTQEKSAISTNTFFDRNMAISAVVVLILLSTLATGIFYYFKNKSNKNTVGKVVDVSLMPTPREVVEIKTRTVHAEEIVKNNEVKSSKATPSQEYETNKKTTIKQQEAPQMENPKLIISTIAPGNNAPIAGNPVYIALTTNNQAVACIDSITYIYMNGSSNTVTNSNFASNESNFKTTHILTLPVENNSAYIKVKLKIKDAFNQDISEDLIYKVL